MAQSAYPGHRAQTGAIYFINAALLGAGFLVGIWLRALLPQKTLRPLQILLNIGALVCLFFALKPLPGQFAEIRRHAAAWDEREVSILAQRDAGARSLLVPGVDSLVELMELSPDPANWVNGCAANYYQVDSIRSTE